jgi:hypothetical protein
MKRFIHVFESDVLGHQSGQIEVSGPPEAEEARQISPHSRGSIEGTEMLSLSLEELGGGEANGVIRSTSINDNRRATPAA